MIVPMKKVSLIIMGDQKSETLKRLRKLGILHIESVEGSGKKLEELKERVSLLENALFIVSEKKNKNAVQETVTAEAAVSAAKEIVALEDEKKLCVAERITLSAELDRLATWGELDPEALAALAEKGVDISLYELPKAAYDALGEGVKTLPLQKTKSSVKFLLIRSGSEEEAEIVDSLKAYRLEMPAVSTAEIKGRIKALNARINGIDEKIASFAVYTDSIKKAVKTCEKEIEFEVYATGMANEAVSADGKSVSYFTGYVEEENLESLKKTAKENAWGLLVEEPTQEDNVPTKLKNNKFVSLIYPLTDFLGTVPGYFEYDISGWFLGFILIFFGIIFGDGGYGLLISAVAGLLIGKSLLAKKPVPPAFLLVGLFGLSTIIWGTLTCTWFGLSPSSCPSGCRSCRFPSSPMSTPTKSGIPSGQTVNTA